jgi:hypothetical protein
MSWVAAAIAGTAAVGYVAQDNASRNAAEAQRQAVNSSNDTQLAIYNQQREDTTPWRQAGVGALNSLESNMGDFNHDFTMNDFQKDPGYQFRMDEGMKALQGSAAARGSLNSGGTLKALDRYSQGLASQEYQGAYDRYNNDRNQRFNRLASIAGIGQTANSQMNSASANYGNNVSANTMAAGNANAAQAIAQGNNVTNTLGTGMNSWMQYQMMNRAFPAQG